MNELEQNRGKVGFFNRFFMIFTVSILAFSVAGYLDGESGGTFTSLYRLGSAGLTYEAIAQLLFTSLMISVIVEIFFSERFFKDMMIITRTVWMLICITIGMVICIVMFDWFPVDMWQGWVGFFVSFGLCFTVSTLIMVLKTRAETKKYEKLLEHYKSSREDDEEDNE